MLSERVLAHMSTYMDTFRVSRTYSHGISGREMEVDARKRAMRMDQGEEEVSEEGADADMEGSEEDESASDA
jgi:hypothetical protein